MLEYYPLAGKYIYICIHIHMHVNVHENYIFQSRMRTRRILLVFHALDPNFQYQQ